MLDLNQLLSFTSVWLPGSNSPHGYSRQLVLQHQRVNSKPLRNEDGTEWRRLTRIINEVLEKFRQNSFKNSQTMTYLLQVLKIT